MPSFVHTREWARPQAAAATRLLSKSGIESGLLRVASRLSRARARRRGRAAPG
eukprot:CAMPEP_0114152788 /NCGR_PEP_ID=MMETSP0043_2-20121206/24001_1 /TAXON_ID=464988 /ORGANISM="Hemiselmis andersenii, Strain CCMP644" /LENGTH=52 /DNA_ID=CAMNT_0001247765 /DNA_START=167 /DNA_END=322 /DNA_ORIENTATION=-